MSGDGSRTVMRTELVRLLMEPGVSEVKGSLAQSQAQMPSLPLSFNVRVKW